MIALFCTGFTRGQSTTDDTTQQYQGITPHQLAVVKERASRGEARAQWMLGNAYREGVGVPQAFLTRNPKLFAVNSKLPSVLNQLQLASHRTF